MKTYMINSEIKVKTNTIRRLYELEELGNDGYTIEHADNRTLKYAKLVDENPIFWIENDDNFILALKEDPKIAVIWLMLLGNTWYGESRSFARGYDIAYNAIVKSKLSVKYPEIKKDMDWAKNIIENAKKEFECNISVL